MSQRTLQPLCDKIGRERVDAVIRDFYQVLRSDPELRDFFAGIEDFTEHERRIADFWWTAMGGRLEEPPTIDMVGRHMPLGITDEAIDRWLALFREALDRHLEPALAEQWHAMARGIADRLRRTVVAGEPPGVPFPQRGS